MKTEQRTAPVFVLLHFEKCDFEQVPMLVQRSLLAARHSGTTSWLDRYLCHQLCSIELLHEVLHIDSHVLGDVFQFSLNSRLTILGFRFWVFEPCRLHLFYEFNWFSSLPHKFEETLVVSC